MSVFACIFCGAGGEAPEDTSTTVDANDHHKARKSASDQYSTFESGFDMGAKVRRYQLLSLLICWGIAYLLLFLFFFLLLLFNYIFHSSEKVASQW